MDAAEIKSVSCYKKKAASSTNRWLFVFCLIPLYCHFLRAIYAIYNFTDLFMSLCLIEIVLVDRLLFWSGWGSGKAVLNG